MKTQSDLTGLLALILEIDERIKLLKSAYKRQDEAVALLIAQDFKEARVGDKIIRLTDNFAEKNTAFRMAFVRRFEISVTDAKGADAKEDR